MTIESRLTELGITLPVPAKPLAAYIPAVAVGNLVFTSGQLPTVEGKLVAGGQGSVGASEGGAGVTKEEAKTAARVCLINALAAAASVIGGIERIERIIKLTCFVASAKGFTEQPYVANGASELLNDIFAATEHRGEHARSAVGVAELPLGASVEIELIGLIAPIKS